MTHSRPSLGRYLDSLSRSYGPRFLHTDPIGEVRRFSNPEDRELAAFLAAGLAFGRVGSILTHLRDLWSRLDNAPARTIDRWSAADAKRSRGFGYRWVRGDDMALVMGVLGRVRKKHGSLAELFLAGYDPDSTDLARSLGKFVKALKSELRYPGSGRRIPENKLSYGVRYFFSNPARGGACKRLNLFLRWMVREDDGIDLGLLPLVRANQLVMPLDTHVSRITRYLGLTRRQTVDWKMASEVTDSLKVWDPDDPVRYDFAISRLGILASCPRRVNPVRCRACSLVPVCVLGRSVHA